MVEGRSNGDKRGNSRGAFKGSSRGSFRGGFTRGRGSFRGGFSRGRGSFRGKRDTRKYMNGKEGKTDEIRRALTHRSNMRKNYFKILKKEGMEVPSKDDHASEEGNATEDDHDHASEDENSAEDYAIQGNEKIQQNEDDAFSSGNEDNNSSDNDDSGKTKSEIKIIKEKVKSHAPLTFQERILLKKDRREKDKERKMQKTKEKLDHMRQRNVQRKMQTDRLKTARTNKGQILMGPRINSLLEKIKQDKGL